MNSSITHNPLRRTWCTSFLKSWKHVIHIFISMFFMDQQTVISKIDYCEQFPKKCSGGQDLCSFYTLGSGSRCQSGCNSSIPLRMFAKVWHKNTPPEFTYMFTTTASLRPVTNTESIHASRSVIILDFPPSYCVPKISYYRLLYALCTTLYRGVRSRFA